MPEETKPWWASKTILGALAVLVATAVRMIAPEADLGEGEILNVLTLATQFAGALFAIFGRFAARVIVSLRRS